MADDWSRYNVLTGKKKKPIGMINGFPDYGYGMRYQEPDVTDPQRPKETGYYGEVPRPDGNGYSTEIGMGTQYGEIPSMVPGLDEQEMNFLLNMKDTDRLPDSIVKKAKSHAAWRRLQGMSPWAGINDNQQYLTPGRNKLISSEYGQ